MKYRKLGRNGPSVSAISMGRGSEPVRFGDPLEQEFNATIQRACALGINFFDSSDTYWGTRHEVLPGRAEGLPEQSAGLQQVHQSRPISHERVIREEKWR